MSHFFQYGKYKKNRDVTSRLEKFQNLFTAIFLTLED